jgi:hypothetical protein
MNENGLYFLSLEFAFIDEFFIRRRQGRRFVVDVVVIVFDAVRVAILVSK